MAEHAVLSASSSSRWIQCPPSARLCAATPDEGSPYAKEGTDAHALCEYKVRKAIGLPAEDPTDNLDYFTQEMATCTDDYCSFVLEQVQEAKELCPDPLILVEQRLDFSSWVPHGFGTGDCLIIADGTLHIIDFKYGVGILVEAAHNTQMMCYALGALDTYETIYDIKDIRLTIFQPRRSKISTWEISRDDLMIWAATTLRPAAELAYNGKGNYKAGEHCRFCKARASCRARAEYNLKLAQYDFQMPSSLTETEIAAILPRIDELITWGNDIREYALQKALAGTRYPGYKVVQGKSIRKYSDEQAVASAVTEAGFDPYEKKLLGITAMTSLLGKKRFNELLGSLVMKPPGKPTLVPDTDKRPELNSAEDDFKDADN